MRSFSSLGARYVSWPQKEFYRLMQQDQEFAYAAQLMISRTLSRKLGNAREDQRVMSDYVVSLATEAEKASRASRRLLGDEMIEAAEDDARATAIAASVDIGLV